MKIYCAKIWEDISTLQLEKLLFHVDAEKAYRIRNLKKIEDIKRVLLGDLLVRKIISSNLNISNENIHFNRNLYGKPYVINVPNFHFNISHSGDWVVCATDNMPIGIDVELVKPIDINMLSEIISFKEQMDLKNKNESQKQSYFYELWTLKESYIKALGKGMSIPLNSLDIKITKRKSVVVNSDKNIYYLKCYGIDKKYKLSVCSSINNFPNKIIKVNTKNLLTF